ncbi:ATP-binding protein [Nonlabens antarcticus]|uniref:ATP-binding protein n=1 Tax=Nonlabens antarcticus TaxID=392714 RepID=UPI001891608A|nr:ATP-binding protein [Nonlabens antarcticus]
MQVIRRKLEAKIKEGLAQYPILAITGPRQSGKTTLLRECFKRFAYVSLENPDIRKFAKSDPNKFLQHYPAPVILDEVQQVPELFSYLQTKVDDDKLMGQYILSGSHNFQLMESITQSLAGRVALFTLLPFDAQELKHEGLLLKNWKEMAIKGFYPAIYDRNLNPSIFYKNYIKTYVERDVAMITNVQDKRRFTNFLSLCAARHGQLLNLNNLANECGISQPTAKSWLSILESSYLIFQLSPYFKNYSKRVVKTPKIYFYDTGLVCYLLGIRTIEDIDENLKGSLFENLVMAEIIKQNEHQQLLLDFWFWRDSNEKEVDVLTQHGTSYKVYEIKSTTTITDKLFKNMDYFDNLTQNKVRQKTLVYAGGQDQDRTSYQVRQWDTVL